MSYDLLSIGRGVNINSGCNSHSAVQIPGQVDTDTGSGPLARGPKCGAQNDATVAVRPEMKLLPDLKRPLNPGSPFSDHPLRAKMS